MWCECLRTSKHAADWCSDSSFDSRASWRSGQCGACACGRPNTPPIGVLTLASTHVLHGGLADAVRVLADVLQEVTQVEHRCLLDVLAQPRDRFAHRLREAVVAQARQVRVLQLLQRLQRRVVPAAHARGRCTTRANFYFIFFPLSLNQ